MAKRKKLTTAQRRWSRNISNVRYRYNKMLKYMKETGWDISNVPSFDSFNLKRSKASYEKAKREYRKMKSIATKKMDGKVWSYREFDRSKRSNRARDARNKRDGYVASSEGDYILKKLEQNIVELFNKMVEHAQPDNTAGFYIYNFQHETGVYTMRIRSIAMDRMLQELEVRRYRLNPNFVQQVTRAYELSPDFLTPNYYYDETHALELYTEFLDMIPDDLGANEFIEQLANSDVNYDAQAVEVESENKSVIVPTEHPLNESPEGFFDNNTSEDGEFYAKDDWDDMMDEFWGDEN